MSLDDQNFINSIVSKVNAGDRARRKEIFVVHNMHHIHRKEDLTTWKRRIAALYQAQELQDEGTSFIHDRNGIRQVFLMNERGDEGTATNTASIRLLKRWISAIILGGEAHGTLQDRIISTLNDTQASFFGNIKTIDIDNQIFKLVANRHDPQHKIEVYEEPGMIRKIADFEPPYEITEDVNAGTYTIKVEIADYDSNDNQIMNKWKDGAVRLFDTQVPTVIGHHRFVLEGVKLEPQVSGTVVTSTLRYGQFALEFQIPYKYGSYPVHIESVYGVFTANCRISEYQYF